MRKFLPVTCAVTYSQRQSAIEIMNRECSEKLFTCDQTRLKHFLAPQGTYLINLALEKKYWNPSLPKKKYKSP